MRAIILAAGEGNRLRPYTADRPKCLVEFPGRPLLVQQIEMLTACGIDDITVVTGYRADQIEKLGYKTVHNPAYDRTNMVASLMCARQQLDGGDDVLVAYADILYEKRVLQPLLDCEGELSVAVNLEWLPLWTRRMDDPLGDAETLKVDEKGCIVELGSKPKSLDEIEGQYMGLLRFGAEACPRIVDFHDALDPAANYAGKDLPNMYMTTLLQALADAGWRLRSVPVRGGWLEVDTTEDLECYRAMARNGELDAIWKADTTC